MKTMVSYFITILNYELKYKIFQNSNYIITYTYHFVDEVLNLDEFDSDDEIEDPCTYNTGVQEQGNQSVEARETVEEPGYATPNNDIYQDISVTAWHFSQSALKF